MASERFSQKLDPVGSAGSAFGVGPVGPVGFVAGLELGAGFGVLIAPDCPACFDLGFGLGFGSDLKDGENGGGACV